ncbi:MAG: ABC transporter permease, partial [Lentisphaeria bacterium]|nr:ABC transporter permease [Lentisphaeria bacterium]
MQLPADILLAARYLRPKRTFVSIITLLSVFGPMLGVALLIIVTSVMAGFDRNIRERILGMQAHLQLAPVFSARGRRQVIEAPEHVLKALKEAGAVGAPIIEGPILIQQRDQVVA